MKFDPREDYGYYEKTEDGEKRMAKEYAPLNAREIKILKQIDAAVAAARPIAGYLEPDFHACPLCGLPTTFPGACIVCRKTAEIYHERAAANDQLLS